MPYKIYDISVPISNNMIVFPGDPKPEIKPMLQIEKGDAANVSKICMGTHTGTHVDPPIHFVTGGDTIDRLPLTYTVGKCDVIDVGDADAVDVNVVKQADIKHSIVLFKTRNSQLWAGRVFEEKFVYITPDAAEYLVNKQVHTIGIDFLSVEEFGSSDARTHHIFLENSVVLIEGLNLERVPVGKYFLVCLPLKIEQGDGGPARAVLIEGML
jgi:arylformamidase